MKKTIHWYEKKGKGSYADKDLRHFMDFRVLNDIDYDVPQGVKVAPRVKTPHRKRFWMSIKRASDCYFSRRNGHTGKIIRGYSVCIRLFNIDIL